MTPGDLFSKRMTPIEIQYKTHNQELIAIVETFETWLHYSEGCKSLFSQIQQSYRVIYKELELPTGLKIQAEEDSFKDENSQVFHRLQSSLMNTSLSGQTKATSHPPSLHQVPISSLGSSAVSRPRKIFTKLVGWVYGSRSCRQKSKKRGKSGRGWKVPTKLVGWGYDSREQVGD